MALLLNIRASDVGILNNVIELWRYDSPEASIKAREVICPLYLCLSWASPLPLCRCHHRLVVTSSIVLWSSAGVPQGTEMARVHRRRRAPDTDVHHRTADPHPDVALAVAESNPEATGRNLQNHYHEATGYSIDNQAALAEMLLSMLF